MGVDDGGAYAAADEDDVAGVGWDVGGFSEGADDVGEEVAGGFLAEEGGGGADGLDDEGDGAVGAGGAGDGEGDAFAGVVGTDDNELAGAGVLDNMGGLDDKAADVGREPVGMEDRVCIGISHLLAHRIGGWKSVLLAPVFCERIVHGLGTLIRRREAGANTKR